MTTVPTISIPPNLGALSAIKPGAPAAAPAKRGRMKLSSVTDAPEKEPHFVLVYGIEGVGKSTFAAGAPSPIIVQAENVGRWIPGKRFPVAESFDDVLEACDELEKGEHDFKTAIFETIDHIEPLVWAHVIKGSRYKTIEEYGGGYAKGYEAALDTWRIFLKRLEGLRYRRGMNVVLVGHANVKSFKNPLGGDFDRYTPKLHHKAAALFKEKADHVLFARHESYAHTGDDKRTRGVSTGARVLHCQWSAAYDAKSRGHLPDFIPLDWDAFDAAVNAAAPKSAARLRAELSEILPSLAPEVAERAAAKAAQVGEDAAQLARIVDHARALAMAALEQQVEQEESCNGAADSNSNPNE